MKLYADHSARFAGQVLGDILFICWLVVWVWVGTVVHDATLDLAGPGRQTAESASSLSGSLKDAGDSLGGLPVVGDSVASPFDAAAGASDRMAAAGRAEVRTVQRLADLLGLSIALIPILIVSLFFVPRRWRFVREATAAQRFIDADADLDLFALRAMTHQPMHVLARVSDDPVAALRDGDRAVIARLAEIELRTHGLRPPAGAGA